MMYALKTQLAAAAAFMIFIIFIFTSQFTHVESKWKILGQGHDEFMVDVSGYPYQKPEPLPWHPPSPKFSNSTAPATSELPDRLIVMTKLEQDDVSWVGEEFSGWHNQILTVNGEFAKLHYGAQRTDKGRIANAYLTYLIEHYHSLPETIVFLNGHPTNPETAPDYDKAAAVESLNVKFIQETGFANLRCVSKTGCTSSHLPMRNPPDEFRTLEVAIPNVWKDLFGNDNVPEKLASPCCSEFAVSRDQIQKRSVEEYLKYWEWLNKAKMDDDTTGLVFEYLWHVIFGKDPEYCPELKSCECDVFGRC
jgi:hypothetical protein